jgi:hypothetical protein
MKDVPTNFVVPSGYDTDGYRARINPMPLPPPRPRTKAEARIPYIDLRRIALYGPCQRPSLLGRALGKPCTRQSLRDDIHFGRCPQSRHSHSLLELEWR